MRLTKLIQERKIQTTSQQYIVDSQGQRVSVILGIEYYQQLLERLEELEDIYAFDRTEASQDEVIPLAQAIIVSVFLG